MTRKGRFSDDSSSDNIDTPFSWENDFPSFFAEFTQAICHDLQSPVKKITSFLNLLELQLKGNLDGKSAEYIQRIEKNAAHFSQIMKKFNDFARFTSVDEPIERIDLNALVNDVRHEWAPLIEERQAVLTLTPLPFVSARRAHIRRVWKNLLHNALLYSVSPPRIEIGVETNKKNPVFFVADEGPGFPTTDQNKIFRIFPKFDATSERPTGTGLMMCKIIVHNHGGVIWAETRPGNGARISFTLPERTSTNA